MHWYPSLSSGECVRVNSAGLEYEEFGCLYPFWGKTFAPFENSYDPGPVRDFMVQNPHVPILTCITYVIAISLGQQYFSTRPAWNWRRTLALWNLGLSIFSLWGFVRILPVIMHRFSTYSINDNLCFDPEHHFGSGSNGVWAQVFVLSKFPELLDTFFLIIHKKPLVFLHWYHHVTVLLYSYHSYVTKSPTAMIFCVMNYGVHAMMYFYYFLMAIKAKPKFFNPMIITVAQIGQMVGGVITTVWGWYIMLYEKIPGCWLTFDNNLAGLIVYGSYLTLFVNFFFQRYTIRKSKSHSSTGNSSLSSRPATLQSHMKDA